MLYVRKTFDYEYPPEEADIVLLGIPWDYSQTGYPTRYGPMFIREALRNVIGYDPVSKRNVFKERKFCDLGDVEVVPGNWKLTEKRVMDTVNSLLGENPDVFPVFLGGDHLITLGVLNAMKKRMDDLTVIDFDAHRDLVEDFLGEKYSHFTWARHVPRSFRLRQAGVRSFTEEEERTSEKLGITDNLENIEGPVYVTIDLDVMDLPDVGTPEPGGLSFGQLRELLGKAFSNNVVGMDIVECGTTRIGSPSAVAAANLIKCAIGHKKN